MIFAFIFSKEETSKYSLAWLEKNLSQSEIGLSGSEFAVTIADLLVSSRSSDDLQTELFDLLGFDRIELIQEVLGHRKEIVDSYNINKKVSSVVFFFNFMSQKLVKYSVVVYRGIQIYFMKKCSKMNPVTYYGHNYTVHTVSFD